MGNGTPDCKRSKYLVSILDHRMVSVANAAGNPTGSRAGGVKVQSCAVQLAQTAAKLPGERWMLQRELNSDVSNLSSLQASY